MVECDIMKNNRGQALVEFIIVLPIFLLFLISVIDFGNIISKKYSLENDIDVVSELYEDGKFNEINTYAKDKDIKVSYSSENELVTINLSRNVKIISPMLNLIFGKSYNIDVEKSIYKNE